jgi:ankyrin repeat protein
VSSTEGAERPGARRLVDACFDSLAAAATLLDAEPALVFARDGLGETALHYLAVENQLEAVKWLFARGATLDTVSDVQGSPLSEAASLGYEELVAWLLDHGAAVDLPGQGEPTLIEAARSGNAAIVARLLAAGADVAVVNGIGETAMHVACGEDDALAVVEVLLAAGAPIDARRIFDETPLDVAIEAGAQRIVELLSARGAKANTQTS